MTYNPDSENPHGVEDPYADAMADTPSRFAGRVKIEAYTCVLMKGKGKIPFDPQIHQGERTSTAIDITVEPLDATRKLAQRSSLNWTADFRRVIRPSIEELAVKIAGIRGKDTSASDFNPLRELSGLWVSGEYVERPDNKPGDTWTTFKFTDVYSSEQECRLAVGLADEQDFATQGKADEERAALAAFLPGLWIQAEQDQDKFEKLLEGHPLLAKHFDMDSPEVAAITVPF